jgi:Plasmid pRiA4b ORF-3-like protein
MAMVKDHGLVYQLKITLRDIKPPIWRRVQVKDCTLNQLHDIIQTCMGWDVRHRVLSARLATGPGRAHFVFRCFSRVSALVSLGSGPFFGDTGP